MFFVLDRITRTCPFFEELDIIYGKKKSVNPSQITDTAEDDCIDYEYVQDSTPPEEPSEDIDVKPKLPEEEPCKYSLNML